MKKRSSQLGDLDGSRVAVSPPLSLSSRHPVGEDAPSEASVLPMVLAVEDAVLDASGILEISGWAVSLAPIVAVQVFIENTKVGDAIYGLAREDIASGHEAYPHANRSGYHFSANIGRLTLSTAKLRVQAIALGGVSRDAIAPVQIASEHTTSLSPALASGLQTAGNSSIRCEVDQLVLSTNGSLIVEGWSFARTKIIDIQIALDGTEVGRAEIGRSRADVEQHFPHISGAGQAGFAFRKAMTAKFDSEHLIILTITSMDGETRRIELPVQAVSAPLWSETVSVATEDISSTKLFVDRPELAGNRALGIVQGGCLIEGWALARDGVSSVEILLDGSHFDTAKYGERREDIATAFPDWDGALLCGFGLAIPPRALTSGKHIVRVELHTVAGRTTACEFQIEVDQQLGPNGPWALRGKIPATEISVADHVLAGLAWRPRFCIVLGIDDLEESNAQISRTLSSIRDQVYRDWHVIVTYKQSKPAKLVSLATKFSDIAEQITLAFDADSERSLVDLIARTPGGRPDLIAITSAGDIFGCDALLELAVASGLRPEADFFYADERRLNPDSGRIEAFFKPQWSPDLLLGTNYIGRLWCASYALVDRVGATVGDWRQWGEYDLVLRMTETAQDIHHLAKVIAQRADGHIDRPAQEQFALGRALARRGLGGRVYDGCAPGYYRVQQDVTTKGLVSIIIPTCASRGLIRTCLETLRKKTKYRNFEIICIENIPARQRRWKQWLKKNADKVIETREKFNWSRFNNVAAEQATGEFLLFLNDDIEIVDPDWLEALLEYAQQPEVGVVGARLLYPDNKVQHAGIFWVTGGGRHAFRFSPENSIAYFGLAMTVRNVIAVTGACLLVSRREFDELGGFDERHNVVNNDVDFCLRAGARGKRIVYTPHATLIHHELASRSAIADDFDTTAFEERWGARLTMGDPFYHPSLAHDRDDFAPNTEPLELVYAGHPLFSAQEIRKILAVKLDHIGDFITAVPALRRLHEYFPEATISVLGPPSISSFVPLIQEIEEVINFEFFHTRSGLGEKRISPDELSALFLLLAPRRFDLAVDLRKALDTRPILQFTGAKWLAGFDRDNRFSWLDVALEWEGDHKVHRKRSYVGDDLLRLVDAIHTATQPGRQSLSRSLLAPSPIGDGALRLPIVCIHPGVGAATRQWPPEYYATLIDLLVAGHQVAIAVIGGPDEAEIADRVIKNVHHRDAVQSLVGKIKLSELPALLASAVLYVGNNSGPKHIAAGLGVPTIGIHSGAVDAREWGPLGDKALAVRRDMHCSPCYLAMAEDCPRQLACLTTLTPPEVYKICCKLLAIDAAMQ
jgi:O-antigen biosynthesis protein